MLDGKIIQVKLNCFEAVKMVEIEQSLLKTEHRNKIQFEKCLLNTVAQAMMTVCLRIPIPFENEFPSL